MSANMSPHHVHFLLTDSFWALVALLLFLAILYYFKVPQLLLRQLDSRALRIERDLAEAKRLREEAQQLLLAYQKKRAEVEDEANIILQQAKDEAAKLAQETDRKVKNYIEQGQKLIAEKIAQAEAEALIVMRQKIIDRAEQVSQKILQQEMDSEISAQLFSQSLSQLQNKLPKQF